jgi:pyrroloquinoline quinone biosynthesis protein B
MKFLQYLFLVLLLVVHCSYMHAQQIIILGIAQDAGYPHAGCTKNCCAPVFKHQSLAKHPVSFAVTDTAEKKWWLFEATPAIAFQLNLFYKITGGKFPALPNGIFLTHAHIGHYAGLMYLGREAMGASAIPVYTLPRMTSFLQNNGPWSQLVKLNNITLKMIQADSSFPLSKNISLQPFTVPHRDEFSETAGFKINLHGKKLLFIPDIDKWQKWNRNIVDEVNNADIALLDATFFSGGELPNRNISEIPHPLITETMQLFDNRPMEVKGKIWFIHFNHTNPVLRNTAERKQILKKGYHIAEQNQILP